MKRRDFALGLGGAGLAGLIGSGVSRGVAATVAGPAHKGLAKPPILAPTDWPTGELQGDLIGLDRAWSAATDGPPTALGRSDALVVVQNGKLVFERYGANSGPMVRHVSWSMAKSITQALVGIAVAEGKVDIDKPLRVVPHPDPGLTLRRLVTLTDGKDWNEADYSPTKSDATQMLYGQGRLDGAAYFAAKPQAHAPGSRWYYSTGAFQTAAAELQLNLFPGVTDPTARRAAMSDWIKTRLFQPLGMATALAEFDPSGTFYGGSLVYASGRDFARFGELYRLDGVWGGKRILPPGWVKFARTPTVEPTYGAGFWLEAPAGGKTHSLMNGAGPLDAFSCQGFQGQTVLVVPSKALVVVRLGLMSDEDDAWQALGRWLAPMVNALPDAANLTRT